MSTNNIGISKIRDGLKLTSRFLFGQGIVLGINLLVGFIFIRFLPIGEYALYVLAGALLAICATGSDMGLSQAVNSLGSRIRSNKNKLSELVVGANSYRRFLFFISIVVIIVIAYFIIPAGKWSGISIIISIILILSTGWIQTQVSIKKSVLNIHHNADALFHVGLAGALTRLGSVVLCVIWPTAVAALLINFLGIIAARFVLANKSKKYILTGVLSNHNLNEQLKKFIIPLAPAVIYFIFQGQISLFLLGAYGYTQEIAEVGALGRLGQVIAVLMMLNAFLVQPVFARIDNKIVFIKLAVAVGIGLVVFSSLCLATVYWLPNWWLFLLGDNYAGLVKELPLAILTALLALVGATIYTIVVSRNVTRGQTWTIIGGLGSQIAFISMYGIQTTSDALILNLLPAGTYAIIQIIILVNLVLKWDLNLARN